MVTAALAIPDDLLAALEAGELTTDQLRRLIELEANRLGMTFDEAVERARQDGEHVERGGVGPVQVVEHQDEWSVARQASQSGRDRMAEPEACRLWVFRWWRFEVGHELLHRWDHRC